MSVNGASLHSWSFDAMNVLTWAEEAGVSSAWLQFMALPSGPVFLGSLKTADTPEDAGPPLNLTHIQHACRMKRACEASIDTGNHMGRTLAQSGRGISLRRCILRIGPVKVLSIQLKAPGTALYGATS